MNVLEEALEVIKQRGADYGDAPEMYRQIAALWSAWLGVDVAPEDVAHMLIHMKQVRDRISGGHHDSRVDVAGYIAVRDMLD